MNPLFFRREEEPVKPVARRGNQIKPLKSIKIGPGKYKESAEQKKLRQLRRQNQRLKERLEKKIAIIKTAKLDKKPKSKKKEDDSEEVVFTNASVPTTNPAIKEKKTKVDKVVAPTKQPKKAAEKEPKEAATTMQQLTKRAAEGLTQLSGAAVATKKK